MSRWLAAVALGAAAPALALHKVAPNASLAFCPTGKFSAGTDGAKHLLPSFSHMGEDMVAVALASQLLDGKVGGTFLEVGGYNGLCWSNTKLLEYAFGYSGLLIEASPGSYHEMRMYREARSVTLHRAVCEGEPRVSTIARTRPFPPAATHAHALRTTSAARACPPLGRCCTS